MEMPVSRWYDAIAVRKSTRSYQDIPIAPATWQRLQGFVESFQPFGRSSRVVLVPHRADVVTKGVVGGFGKIADAPAYALVVGDREHPHVHEMVGYHGEAFVLEATALDLATCWVGGFFDRRKVLRGLALYAEERVYALVTLGYPDQQPNRRAEFLKTVARSYRRKTLSQLAPQAPLPEQWPNWVRGGIAAARLAPSAMNRQPWLFALAPDRVTIRTAPGGMDFGISKRLDCGAAMLHFEVGARQHGAVGGWHLLAEPLVAEYRLARAEG